jgi:hypothetical protein
MTRMDTADMHFLKAFTGYNMRFNKVKGKTMNNTQTTVIIHKK